MTFFALSIKEMGMGNLEIIVIGLVTLSFPILFILASKNLDSKGVFEWMLEKPSDWVGKK